MKPSEPRSKTKSPTPVKTKSPTPVKTMSPDPVKTGLVTSRSADAAEVASDRATARQQKVRSEPVKRYRTGKRTSEDVAEIFRRFRDREPEPKGELEHVNAYTLLVAVVLSAQATDAGVNKATRPLFKVADTPEKMLELGEDKVREFIKTIGLYRNKAKNVILLSEKLVQECGGQVPRERAALEALPGVGRKTANVVLNMAFGEATMAVDTHVFRVSHRLGLSKGKTPNAVEDDLMKRIPAEFMQHAHHWLILHGRYVCKARAPDCARCPITDLCFSKDKRTL